MLEEVQRDGIYFHSVLSDNFLKQETYPINVKRIIFPFVKDSNPVIQQIHFHHQDHRNDCHEIEKTSRPEPEVAIIDGRLISIE